MSEAEVNCLLAEVREVVGLVRGSNDRVDGMLRRASAISERVKMMTEHQHTLEEVFAQTSDGIRRRQLLEELQKENRERLECLEENAILRENLTEGFDTFMELYERNKSLSSRVAAEKRQCAASSNGPESFEVDQTEFELGQTAALMKHQLRNFIAKSEEVMTKGEEESRELNTFIAALHTWNKGRIELLQPEMMSLFKRFCKSGIPELREMIARIALEEGHATPKEEEENEPQQMNSSIIMKVNGTSDRAARETTKVPEPVHNNYDTDSDELTLRFDRSSFSESSDDESPELNDTIVDTRGPQRDDDQLSTTSTLKDDGVWENEQEVGW